MTSTKVDTLVIGGGQAGLAMSAHLRKHGLDHLVVERSRIAESWRSRRWDSLVANGPAWHDRFPDRAFTIDADAFATKEQVAQYFEDFAGQIDAPIRTGVEVKTLSRDAQSGRFLALTADETIEAAQVVVATGPFQRPSIPAIEQGIAEGVEQIHSNDYRNPGQLPAGAVLVIGAGSSGVQIADELARDGRQVYLSVGPHNRPPRSYRGKDFCWWLGALGHWTATEVTPGAEHVTIAVSGARGGHTVDFRDLAERGMVLVGHTLGCEDGTVRFAPDLADNVRRGDADYLSVLEQADAYIAREGLDFPEEPEAHAIGTDPECMIYPVLELNLAAAGITSVVWATGFAFDFGWLDVNALDDRGAPLHVDGVSAIPGLYFLGLPWLTCRGSAFIWGAWQDAARHAEHIAARATATHA
jgi:putative flavoprotein involved in K+ transport